MTRVLFMGRHAAAAEALRWAASERFELAAVLVGGDASDPVHETAKELGCEILDYEDAATRVASGDLSYDLGISFAYPRIIRSPLLEHPSLGTINLHPAPLPDYRGSGGYNIAILEGLSEWGVTAHYIDAGVDSGPIIEVVRFPIDPDHETVSSLLKTSHTHMLALCRSIMSRAAVDGVLDSTISEGGRFISRQEMELMKKIEPGEDVDRKIRAFWYPPYQGAVIEINGQQFTLVNSAILSQLAGKDH